MADKAIGDLVKATTLEENDLLLVEQSNMARAVTFKTVRGLLQDLVQGKGWVKDVISDVDRDNSFDYHTFVMTDDSTIEFKTRRGSDGPVGNPPELLSFVSEYQETDSSQIPTGGTWQPEPINVQPGNYLWNRITLNFETGDPVVFYSVSRAGLNGLGVNSVNDITPDMNNNVTVTAADIKTDNEKTVQQWLSGHSNQNILMNPFFMVNQRGKTEYSGSFEGGGYTVDRWKRLNDKTKVQLVSADISYKKMEYITISNLELSQNKFAILKQIVEYEKISDTPQLTISVKYADGHIEQATGINQGPEDTSIVTATYQNASVYLMNDGESEENLTFGIRITGASASANIVAVKLEAGSISTLANDSAPEYGSELLKCQRYFYRMIVANKSAATLLGIGEAASDTAVRVLVPLPVKMRTCPTLQKSDFSGFRVRGHGAAAIGITGLDVIKNMYSDSAQVALSATVASGLTKYFSYVLQTADVNNVYLEFSADL